MGGGSPQRRGPATRAPVDSAATAVERELVKLAVQLPVLVAPQYDALGEDCFTSPELQAVHALIAKAGGTGSTAGGEPWVGALLEACDSDQTRATAAVKATLQRVNPEEEPERYYRLFGELVSLEQTVRALRERGIGAS